MFRELEQVNFFTLKDQIGASRLTSAAGADDGNVFYSRNLPPYASIG
ncbi:hypothetical protein ACFL2S_12455 [Thermodesulfobacteriota bacterium]